MLFTPDLVSTGSAEIRSGRGDALLVHSHVPSTLFQSAGLLYFALHEFIEKPATILKATLVLSVTGPLGQAGEVSVGTILTPWLSEDSLSWEVPWAAPGMKLDADYEPPRIVPVVAPDDGLFVSVGIDVTEDLRRWFGGRLENYGWRIASNMVVGTTRNRIAPVRPAVVVKYSDSGAAVDTGGAAAGGI